MISLVHQMISAHGHLEFHQFGLGKYYSILGTGMMWFLAYKMEMSTLPKKSVSALVDDIGDSARA